MSQDSECPGQHSGPKLPPHPELLDTPTIPLYQFTSESTFAELVCEYRYRCPGYDKATFPFDTLTDPVPPLVNSLTGARESSGTRDCQASRAQKLAAMSGLGVRFKSTPDLVDEAIADILAARRIGAPLGSEVAVIIDLFRGGLGVPFRGENLQSQEFDKEVHSLLNSLLKHHNVLFDGLKPWRPDASWGILGNTSNDESCDSGFGERIPFICHVAQEDKTTFVTLSAVEGKLGLFAELQQSAEEGRLLKSTAIATIGRRTTKLARVVRQCLGNVTTRHPKLYLLGSYTKIVFIKVTPPSEDLPEVTFHVSREFLRMPSGGRYDPDGDKLNCDVGQVSITTAMLAVTLVSQGGPPRAWDLKFFWPELQDIKDWVRGFGPATTTEKRSREDNDEDDDMTPEGNQGEGGSGENQAWRPRETRSMAARRQSSGAASAGGGCKTRQVAMTISVDSQVCFGSNLFLDSGDLNMNESFALAKFTRPSPSPIDLRGHHAFRSSIRPSKNVDNALREAPSSPPTALSSPVSSSSTAPIPSSSSVISVRAHSSPSSSLASSLHVPPLPAAAATLNLRAFLGQGHLSEVYRARLCDEFGEHEVAVKIVVPGAFHEASFAYLKKGEMTSEAATKAILHEADVYSALAQHQGSIIPQTYGLWHGVLAISGPRDGCPVATEYSEIEAYLLISDYLVDQGTVPSPLEVARVYRMLHSAGVVHGDIALRHWFDGRLVDFEMGILSPRLGDIPGARYSREILERLGYNEQDYDEDSQLQMWRQAAEDENELVQGGLIDL